MSILLTVSSFVYPKDEYILRFSFVTVFYILILRLLKLLPDWIFLGIFMTYLQVIGIGLSYSIIYLIPSSVISVYYWILIGVGFVYKSLEFC